MKNLKIATINFEEIYSHLGHLVFSNDISIMDNVILVWDEQANNRILNVFVNEITKEEKKHLLFICQERNYLFSIWTKIPKRFKNDKLFLKDYNLEQIAFRTNNFVEVGVEKNEQN